MATKVMLAPAIARRDAKPHALAAEAEPKPKRRRSSVFDADGNEVFITLLCLKCRQMRPLAQFGLRKMADGAIRNQPWCRTCRGATAESPRRKRARSAGEGGHPSVSGEPSAVESSSAANVDPARLAAQILAALHGGRR